MDDGQSICTILETSPGWVLASSLLGDRQALFSTDKVYRYVLIITWDENLPSLVVIMLNPSTADEFKNDPTVERCERRARRGGYGSLVVLNLFALRSTDPRGLYETHDAVGPLNDRAIALFTEGAGAVVCGWGTHGALIGRGGQVLDLLKSLGIVALAYQLNRDGSPKHPLYVGYNHDPRVMS